MLDKTGCLAKCFIARDALHLIQNAIKHRM